MGYTRIRSRHSRMSWTLLSYRYYLLMLRKTVWAQQIWMDKTAMEGRLVEVHPCGTPTQNMTQMLLLLYYAEIMYCMCSVSSIWLWSICVWWYGRYRVGGIQKPAYVRHTILEGSITYWAVLSSLFELGNMICDARSPIYPHVQLVGEVKEWVAQKHLSEGQHSNPSIKKCLKCKLWFP